MKKMLVFILTVIMIVLVGCSAAQTDVNSNAMPDYLSIGDKDYINAWELTIIDPSKLVEIGVVEHAYRLAKGSPIYEIEGYPERNVVAVKDESDEMRMLENITGFSVYVWNDGSGQPSHHPKIPESEVKQIDIYEGTKLLREWNGDDVLTFLDLMTQHGPYNEFEYDRTPQYTVLYMTNGALGYNYGIMEKDGEFGLPHIESKLPVGIAQYFKGSDVLEQWRAEVTEGDFIYRLVSEKMEYHAGDPVEIYAELEYIGDKESVTIYHAASPFMFPIYEKTRDYGIWYAMDQPLLHTKVKQGEPLREVYRKMGGHSSDDKEEFVQFIKNFLEIGFPTGHYVVDGSADFYVLSSEDKKEDYDMKAQIEFKVID